MIATKEQFEKKFPNLVLQPRTEFVSQEKYKSLSRGIRDEGRFVVKTSLFETYDSIGFPLSLEMEQLMFQFNAIYGEQLRLQRLYPYLHLGIHDITLKIDGVWLRDDSHIHGDCLIRGGEYVQESDLERLNKEAEILLDQK
jgi:hypothetical protein